MLLFVCAHCIFSIENDAYDEVDSDFVNVCTYAADKHTFHIFLVPRRARGTRTLERIRENTKIG